MLLMHLKRIFRNKWLLTKMFVISPLVKILPIILIQNTLNIMEESTITNLCLWSLFYFSGFESVNMKMKLFSSEKISEIIMSKTTLLKYHLIETTALNISFIPSYIFSLSLYSMIYQIDLNINVVLVCSLAILLCNTLLTMIILILELRFSNYFNKFNFIINIIYICCGVTYPITIFPIIFQRISFIIPLTHVFQFSNQRSLYIIPIFICLYIFVSIVIFLFLVKEQKNFLDRGGTL